MTEAAKRRQENGSLSVQNRIDSLLKTEEV